MLERSAKGLAYEYHPSAGSDLIQMCNVELNQSETWVLRHPGTAENFGPHILGVLSGRVPMARGGMIGPRRSMGKH